MIDATCKGRQEQEYQLMVQASINGHFEKVEPLDDHRMKITGYMTNEEMSQDNTE